MIYVRTDPSFGGIQFYSKKAEDPKIGGAELEIVEYGFWQNRLSDINIRTVGAINFHALRDATTAKFGRGFQGNRYIEEYYWNGNITGTTMLLKYSEVTRRGYLNISSK